MPNIRPIEKQDNVSLKNIILSVLEEFGAVGGGFASSDPEINAMYEHYTGEKKSYFVIEHNGSIVGGAGIAPLTGTDTSICELQKMYFTKDIRGKGLGTQLILLCLSAAKEYGYKTCYLETLTNMTTAQALYKKVGFTPLSAPLGNTGHFGCNTFFSINLNQE